MIEDFFNSANSPLQKIDSQLFNDKGLEVYIKREDLLSELLSGNKFRKLKYNLLEARQQGFETLVSFGGAFSNHLYAFAAAGKLFGFKTFCFVRGEELKPFDNPTLTFAEKAGTELIFVNRTSYRDKQKLLENIKKPYYYIPEGGTNANAIKGIEEMVSEIIQTINPDFVLTAVGTGGTLAGILKGLDGQGSVIGFSSFTKNDEVETLVQSTTNDKNYIINNEYRFGGYGKTTSELLTFMQKFKDEHQIELDQIYTAKMMFGFYDLVKKNHFPKNSKIVLIHTGGLQGNQNKKPSV